MDLLANDPLKTLATFDQPSRLDHGRAYRRVHPGRARVSKQLIPSRSVHTRRLDPDRCVARTGERPGPAGSERLSEDCVEDSRDGGLTWSQRRALVPDRPASPGGLGFFNPSASAAVPQVMPSITCGAGTPNRCVVTYYEARGGLSANGWIAGYGRLVDLRAVLIDAPASSNPAPQQSFQVSRYAYRPLLENQGRGDARLRSAELQARRHQLLSGDGLRGAPAYLERERRSWGTTTTSRRWNST